MRIFWFLILSFLLYSCKEPNKAKDNMSKEKIKMSSGLSQELYSNLIKYQRLYPIPKNGNNDLYVYEAFFFKSKADTFLYLRRSGEGISRNNNEKLIGVYSDINLAPTIIRDSKEFYSRNFIKVIISDSNELKRFMPIVGNDYSESYPPIYKFKVSENKLILKAIDTVWSNWIK